MSILKYDQVDEFYGKDAALEIWDNKDLWATRKKREKDFYTTILRKYGKREVLDCSAATGLHCFELEKAGFSIEGCDKVGDLVERARKNAGVFKSKVRFQQVLWSELLDHYGPARFDAILCLGSSLHHARGRELRLAFWNMFEILKEQGILVVDQRNYHKLFRNKPELLLDECDVTFGLEYPSEREIIFHVQDQRRDKRASIKVFVTFEEELIQLLEEIGFRFCERYGNFNEMPPNDTSDWIQYVFEKPALKSQRRNLMEANTL